MEDVKWKSIESYEGAYEISSIGEIKSLKRFCKSKGGKDRSVPERVLKQKIDKYGYPCIQLALDGKRRNYTVHRLVAQAFIPNLENKQQVNHINGIKTDNSVENLEWCTAQHNVQHSFDTGLQKIIFGAERAFSKMDDRKVREAREKYANGGISLVNLAKEYNICAQTLHDIIRLRSWKHVI